MSRPLGFAHIPRPGLFDRMLQKPGVARTATATVALTDPSPAATSTIPASALTLADLQTIFSSAANLAQFTRTQLNTNFLAGAGNISASIGTSSSLGVNIQNGSFALALFNNFDTRATTQAPSTFALS